MAGRADTTERLQAVEIVTGNAASMTADGRPIFAASEYTGGAMTADGRPIRAVSIAAGVSAQGGPIEALELVTAGKLMTADGRPVRAVQFFNALGAPSPSGGGTSYSAEATALFARMTTPPDATRKGHIDTFIKALLTGATSGTNIWSKVKALWVFAAADTQAAELDWKGTDAYNADITNGVSGIGAGNLAFQADRGVTRLLNGFSATGFVGFSAGITAPDIHLGSWCLTEGASVSANDLTLSSFNTIQARNGGFSRCGTSTVITLPAGSSPQHVITSRTTTTSAYGYRNGVQGALVANSASASQASGSASFLSPGNDRQLAMAHAGTSLTVAEALDFYNASRAYLIALGVGGL